MFGEFGRDVTALVDGFLADWDRLMDRLWIVEPRRLQQVAFILQSTDGDLFEVARDADRSNLISLSLMFSLETQRTSPALRSARPRGWSAALVAGLVAQLVSRRVMVAGLRDRLSSDDIARYVVSWDELVAVSA